MPAAAIALPSPIREGDRLDSSEFLRRWEAMPSLKRAELIDGVVFMPSPVSYPNSDVHKKMCGFLWLYEELTAGCESAIECTWLMGLKDVPQPDLFLRILAECGGQSQVKDRYATGAPEMVVEISASSLSRDLGVKLDLYLRVGVREYVTVLPQSKQVTWRYVSRGRYREIAPSEDGLLRSRTFPGLWLDPAALWNPKRSVRKALEQGTRSPEHATFVRRLAAAQKRNS